MKPYDMPIIWLSILDADRMQSDHDAALSIAFARFYLRFFGGRTHTIRGDA